MGDRNPHSFAGLQFLSGLFLFLVLALYLWLARTVPLLAMIMPVLMMVVGAVGFLVAMRAYGRYRKVYDYQATELWGRQTNGKQARQTLSRIGIAAGTLGLAGLFLWLLT